MWSLDSLVTIYLDVIICPLPVQHVRIDVNKVERLKSLTSFHSLVFDLKVEMSTPPIIEP